MILYLVLSGYDGMIKSKRSEQDDAFMCVCVAILMFNLSFRGDYFFQ